MVTSAITLLQTHPPRFQTLPNMKQKKPTAEPTALTASQRADIEWLTDQMPRAIALANIPQAREAGEVMLTMLSRHARATFAAEFEGLREMRERRAKAVGDRMKQKGPPLWRELHARSAQAPKTLDSKAAERQWLRLFSQKVKKELCGECAAFMVDYVDRINPPDFKDYKGWMIDFHNAVNEKRGAAVLSREEAEAAIRIDVDTAKK